MDADEDAATSPSVALIDPWITELVTVPDAETEGNNIFDSVGGQASPNRRDF